MEQKNSKLFLTSKYILYFGIFFLLFKAQVNGIINPFGFGLYFALIWCNQNILILSPLYIGASYLSSFSVINLYSAIFLCVVMCVIYGIHQKLKHRIKPMFMLLYSLVCLSFGVFLKIYGGVEVWIVFVELVFGLLYMVCAMKVLESLTIRGLVKKFTISQVICGGFLIAGLSCGFAGLEIANISICKLVISFIVLFTTIVLPPLESLLTSLICVMGTVLYSNNPYLVAPVVAWWLTVSCFRGKNKIYICLSLIVCEFMCVYYFGFYYNIIWQQILPCVISSVIAICIPQNCYTKLTQSYNSSFANRGLETVINRTRNNIRSKLLQLSQVFSQMDKVFRSTIKGKASQEDLKALLLTEIKSKMCADCPERNKCYKTYGTETNSTLAKLTNIAFETGKVTLIDIPSTLTGRCFRVNQLVYTINDLIQQYKSYASLVSSIDASKVLISEQLCGVSGVLKQLSFDIGKNVEFDNGLEKEIVDELIYNDIMCCDAIVYYDNNTVAAAVLEIKKEDCLKAKIPQIVSKICKTPMIVETDCSSEHKGWQIVNLKTAPKYDIIFGTAAVTKSSSVKSGDCYSLIRIQDGKILMALCDGMGSGETAQRSSETAISLVENFYKAGFDSEIILSIVNKFLSIGSNDVFSCLDMAVIDLKDGAADFIKLGATNGYIKHKETTTVVECRALPLGIISTINPTIKSAMLNSGDMVILCTDGITDSFSSDAELTDFINNINSVNPQQVADAVVDRAMKNCNNTAFDDMTVLVCKVF